MTLDAPTLLLVLIVFTTVTTFLMVSAALPIGALGEQRLWAAGNVAASLGFVVGALDTAPALVHAGLSYGLIGLGMAIVLRGLRRFCGTDLSWRAVALIAAGALLLTSWFAVVVPDKAARMVVSGLYFGSLGLVSALTLWRGTAGSSRVALVASVAGFMIITAVLWARALLLLAAPSLRADSGLLATIAGVSTLAAATAQVMIAFGLLLLVALRHAEGLERQRLLDGLTGVLNRAGMEHMGQRLLARAQQAGRSVSLVIVDADHFKRINDTHGHGAGDEVLVHLAALLAAQVRPGDVVIRYGGEEFVLLLDGASSETAGTVAQRLRRLVEEAQVPTAAGVLRYQISIGVSCSDTAGYGLDLLLQRADAALYRAKELGRNRVCIDGFEGAQ